MFNIKVGYPSAQEEEKILAVTCRNEKAEIKKVFSSRAIVKLQKLVASVAVSEYINKYVAQVVRATRPDDPSAPEFIRELVEGGVIGASLFLLAMVRVLRTGHRCYRFGGDRLTRGIGLG